MSRTSVPQTDPPGEGWRDWCWLVPWTDGPYYQERVEAWRRGWDDVEVLKPTELPPLFNVAGLYWRPIPKPKLEPEVAKALA